MDLREVAAELYAAPPAEFVAQRAAAAGRADRELARGIRALRKPSAAAAAVNALVRAHPDLVEDVLGVGDRLREAFGARDRERIRALTAERQRLLQRAGRELEALSPAVRREVEETLQAAVIDAAAAAAVRSGLLVRAIESTGLDEADVSGAVAVPVEAGPAPRRLPGAREERKAEPEPPEPTEPTEPEPPEPAEPPSDRRERLRRLRTAERALGRARTEAESLDDELDEETDRRSELEAEVDSLERRLRRTEEELEASRRAERELRRRITAARASVRDAERALREAQKEDGG